MLETILNLVWVGVTLGGVWLWRFRWAASRRRPDHNFRQEAVAVVCVLALLFPVISLTDDLHPEVVPVDSVSSKRNHGLLLAHGAHAAHSKPISGSQALATALIPRSPAVFQLFFAWLACVVHLGQSVSRGAAIFGRAPPFLA